MKQLIALSLFCIIWPVTYAQQQYWQQQVNYTIDVTLNDTEHTLDGYVKMDYMNRSPDSLRFIWIHLWPNAYKNDRTAFSDQLLENGNTKFYFSDNAQRGYINRLDFKVNGITALTADHPLHQDIVQLQLPQPLPPGGSIRIETPFHVKLPENFSRGGHKGQAYMITQWYPKPAVYDSKGWHPMPYLDQGEFYSEFGNYNVQVTLPKNYKVCATGQLVNQTLNPFTGRVTAPVEEPAKKKKMGAPLPKKKVPEFPPSDPQTKVLTYHAENVHDFAWFADKRFISKQDSMLLPSGKKVDLYVYYLPTDNDYWTNVLGYIKKTILTRSQWLGEYPYGVCTVVEAPMGFNGGMEYPTITSITAPGSAEELERIIEHEVGHNWNYGILANNERDHPWMDEGINRFYDNRYDKESRLNMVKLKTKFPGNRMPDNLRTLILNTLIGLKKDQPISTSSERFNKVNMNITVYDKTAQWLALVEDSLGQPLFDSCMHVFYQRWQFKHPYPEVLKQTMEEVSGRDLSGLFQLLDERGALPHAQQHKRLRFTAFFNLKETDKYNYISIAPAVGYNFYDKVFVGALVHNYTLPLPRFRFVAIPLFGTSSKAWGGLGHLSYTWFAGKLNHRIEAGLGGAKYMIDTFQDSTGRVNYLDMTKLASSLRINFANRDARSTIGRYIEWKTFFITETGLQFTRDTIQQIDIITYPKTPRYINRLRFGIENHRVLYPWSAVLETDQGDGFVRSSFTGNYFFNYPKGGGLSVRLFAGKFFYTAEKTISRRFQTDRYFLNMTGPKGDEDYTYSNYFVGRSEFDKFSSQQIMIRDGGFKVRTDLLSDKIGKTDDWLAAVNFTTTIPPSINPLEILPVKIPLRVFVDIGSYAGAWKKNAATGRMVYDAGLQLSLFNNLLNVYIPLLYSKVYKDYFISTIPEKRFVKNISFSIDLQHAGKQKLFSQLFF